MTTDLARLDATAQAALVRDGEATPRELVEAAIARLEKLNPQLNAVIRPRLEKARTEAEAATLPDGPFRGVPFLIKDLFCVQAGDELHCGNPALKAAHYTAPADTYLAARFRAAGLISIGQSNTPEFGFTDTTEPEAYGPTRNPWNLEHSTGGSSGGSAAAVAARIVPLAHANDGGGSIRNPASHCGLVGLKPSRGRVSLGPDFAEGWGGLINEGVVSLSVRDTATTLDAISGVMQGDPYSAPKTCSSFADAAQTEPQRLRIGFMKRRPGNGSTLHPDCIAAVEHTAQLLESLGHHVEEAYPAALDEDSGTPFDTLFFTAAARSADEVAEKLGREVGPNDFEAYSWYIIEVGRKISAADYLAAHDWSGAWSRRVAEWWAGDFDVLLSPTMSTPPPRIGYLCGTAAEPEEVMRRSFDMIAFTPAWNMTGQPGISLPLHWSDDGLPIGVHLVPEYGREDLLLSLAAQLERAQPWIDRLPPVHA